MFLWDWLRGLFPGGENPELRGLREKLFLLGQESSSIALDLTRINGEREGFTQSLLHAPSEEQARLWSQRLRGLDVEDRGLRARWSQVDQELQTYQAALANLKNMRNIDLRKVEQEMERLNQISEERARQQVARRELEDEMRLRQETAWSAYERANQQQEPDPYMTMWQSAKAQERAAKDPSVQRPEGA